MGSGRTTLKLPEYLACGKCVLASDVGEARRLIGENGQLLRYAGGRDLAYARAMAAAVVALPDRAELDRRGASGVERPGSSAGSMWRTASARPSSWPSEAGRDLPLGVVRVLRGLTDFGTALRGRARGQRGALVPKAEPAGE